MLNIVFGMVSDELLGKPSDSLSDGAWWDGINFVDGLLRAIRLA